MTVMSSPLYRWRVGEVEITRVLEFEAALFEPIVLYPQASPESPLSTFSARERAKSAGH